LREYIPDLYVSYVKCLILCTQEMLDEMQCGIQQYDWPDWWYFGKERRFLHAPEEASHSQHSVSGTLYTGLAVVTAEFKKGIEQLTVPMRGSKQAYMDDSLPAVWVIAATSAIICNVSVHACKLRVESLLAPCWVLQILSLPEQSAWAMRV